MIAATLSAATAAAQVNTEAMASQVDDAGWAWEFAGSVVLKRGNSDSTAIGVGSQLRYLTLHTDPDLPDGGEPWFRDRFLVAGDFSFEASSGERVDNKAFAHVRWTRMWIPRVGHEIYSQVEYAEFRRLNRRTLFGAGGRFVIANQKNAQLWFGSGYFVELEDYDLADIEPVDFERRPTNHRWNNYVSLKVNDDEERVVWTNTLYVQPRFDWFEDVQILYDGSVNFVILGPLSIGLVVELVYDSKPVPGVEKTDVKLTNVVKVAL